jgi:hypothetical protein
MNSGNAVDMAQARILVLRYLAMMIDDDDDGF